MPKSRVDEFLNGSHKRLGKNAVAFMADNVYASGFDGQLVNRKEFEDTFKLRQLPDGSKCEVLKNYYDHDSLRQLLSPIPANLEVHIDKYFWWTKYIVA